MDPSLKGKIQTVLGIVEPSELGQTLTHEHLYYKGGPNLFVPQQPAPAFVKGKPILMEDLGWIRQYPYSHEDNMIFYDEKTQSAIFEEMKIFKKSGGGCIVENSTQGLTTDYGFLKRVAKETGVHVVAGTGYYVAPGQTSSVLAMAIEEIMATMRRDLLEGTPDAKVKCGVIGEVGCSWPIHAFERKSVQATARLQEEVRCPVIIHPGRNKKSPAEILRIFQEAGGKAEKMVMSHLDRAFLDDMDLAEFASLGCYCEFDLFGIETSHYQLNLQLDMPSDAQRIARIRHLVEQGFEDRIVVAHDLHTKHRLKKFGGHGYSHILENVVPKMLMRGISQEVVDKLLIYNPQSWLTFW